MTEKNASERLATVEAAVEKILERISGVEEAVSETLSDAVMASMRLAEGSAADQIDAATSLGNAAIKAAGEITCAAIASPRVINGIDNPPKMVADILLEILNAVAGNTKQAAPTAPLEPAVNPKKSITDDFIICLEDGKKFKSLKRHLMTHYGLTPEQYREKWGLPADYPMVAPNYAEARSQLAKKMGLGKKK